MSKYAGKTVAEILRWKKASIKQAALDPGSPSWDDILELTFEELTEKAKRNEPGCKTLKKLLGKREYDK